MGSSTVSIGNSAGQYGNTGGTTTNSVFIGYKAGQNVTGSSSFNLVCIGEDAGNTNPSQNSVSIGRRAGFSGSGRSCINIGELANESGTNKDNCIVLNAQTSTVLNALQAGSCYIAPIRNKNPDDLNFNNIYHDASNNEVYRSQYNVGLKLIESIDINTAGQTIQTKSLYGYIIRVYTTGVINSVALPSAIVGANVVLINETTNNVTVTLQVGDLINGTSTLTLQNSKKVHHVYCTIANTWYAD